MAKSRRYRKRTRHSKNTRNTRSKKRTRRTGGMMDHYGSIGIPVSRYIRDLKDEFPYNANIKLIFPYREAYDRFIRDIANSQDHSVSGYAYYGKTQMLDNTRKKLDLLLAQKYVREQLKNKVPEAHTDYIISVISEEFREHFW